MKIKFIINPKSKNGKRNNLEMMLKDRFSHYDVDIELTSYPNHAFDMAKRAVQEKVDTIVAVGGDGTVNQILNGIIGSEITLGIVPTGTANDLASYYHIPKDLTKACDVIIDRHIQLVDVINVNGWCYATAGGIGLSSEVANLANSIKANRTLGKLLDQVLGSKLYLFATLWSLLKREKSGIPLIVRWNGSFTKTNALALMVDNQPFLGKNFLVSPGAVNDDGVFDVCLIENSNSFIQTLSTILKVLTGKHIFSPSVKTCRESELLVEVLNPTAFLGDGETCSKASEFKIKIIPQALNIITPQPNGKDQSQNRSNDYATTLNKT